MAEPPKRRAWFQLHLSTCVVLMAVVAGFLGVNLCGTRFVDDYEPIYESMYGKDAKEVVEYRYLKGYRFGWPEPYFIRHGRSLGLYKLPIGGGEEGSNEYTVETQRVLISDLPTGYVHPELIRWNAVAVDAFCMLAACVLVAILLEWRIRWLRRDEGGGMKDE